MLFRFSLYGFLKNQVYWEPFLLLAFLGKGLTYFQIGILIGFREVLINILEIPTGAIADIYGRRKAMIYSFVAYIISFALFASSRTMGILMLAMFFFAIGEAFRSGTHKAMIFDWLRQHDRLKEKTQVYGFTRSWSKLGSALSVLISAGLVFYTGNLDMIFWVSVLPYLLGIINFLGYPDSLDAVQSKRTSFIEIWKLSWESLSQSWHNLHIRRLCGESTVFDGLYETTKDYLQPITKHAALALPLLLTWNSSQRTAILIGLVYFTLNIISAFASRYSDLYQRLAGGAVKASSMAWVAYFMMFALLIPTLTNQWHGLAIVCFVGLGLLQNLWEPIILSRFDDHTTPENQATILSIQSQTKSFFTMLLAPIVGFLADHYGFWPIGIIGVVMVAGVWWGYYRKQKAGES